MQRKPTQLEKWLMEQENTTQKRFTIMGKRIILNGRNNTIKHLKPKKQEEGENIIEEKDFDEYDYIIHDETLTDTEKYQMIGRLWMKNKKDKLKSWFKREKK